MPLISTKIRIEGTPEQIEEALKRIKHVFVVSGVSRPFKIDRDPETRLVYLRCYTYRNSDTLLEQLQAAQSDIKDLETKNGELELEVERLQQQLGILPRPRPHDAVLSPRHK